MVTEWTVKILRKSDQKPRTCVAGDVAALAAVGDLVRFELGTSSFAKVVERRFDYDEQQVILLVEPVEGQ